MSNIPTNLIKLLSTSVDFYFVYEYFHWNISGQDFREFHKMFDKHAEIVYLKWDLITERIR